MLRWRLFGISFCIQPSFWIFNALFAYFIYQPIMRPQPGQILTRDLLIVILIDVLVMLATVMVHELGHAIVGLIFGQPGNINIAGLGGQTVGQYTELSSWQRILVTAAGPGAGFLFVAALTAFDGRPWNWCMEYLKLPNLKCELFLVNLIDRNLAFNPQLMLGPNPFYDLTILLLFSFNLFLNIMNLLPIIPMDGGMIFKEVCTMISPVGGLKFAFFCSFGLASLATVYFLVIVLSKYQLGVPPQVQNYYPFAFPELSLLIFGMLAFQSLQTYRQLSTMQRYRDFMQDDDDFSGPRRGSSGVVEVEPKDPRDFAPRAPGSERPRM
jgi:Zn-dependent protease